MTVTTGQLAKQLQQSGILTAAEVAALRQQSGLTHDDTSGDKLAKLLVKEGHLTKFQAQLAYGGKAKNLVMGSYVILEKLGEGGMGQVFKARHKRMKREVALKILAPQFVKDEGALQRFHREVEAAARLTHQNIVTAYDADEVRGTHYLVMEYVRGEDLSQIVKKSGPLSVAKAVNCVLQAAQGLAYAHDQNVVHRDIKPANLLLDQSGIVKILDMGLARFDEAAGDADQAAALTGTGMLMGTVDYMSPEQALDSKTADHRSDIYSLGCTLYSLITGKPLYDGDTVMKRVMAHQTAAVPQLPLDDLGLQQIFEQMVAKKSVGRFQSTGEVVTELNSWLHVHRDSASLQVTAEVPLQSESSSISPQAGLLADSVEGVNAQHAVGAQRQSLAEPTADTSPSSSADEATILPGKREVDARAPQTLDVAAIAIETVDEPLLPNHRRVSRRKSKSNTDTRSSASGGGLRGKRKLLMAGAGGLAAVILLGALIFRFTDKDGTVVVEVDGDRDVAMVEIDGKEVSFAPAGTDKRLTFKVEPGTHKLFLKTEDGLELITDLGTKPLAIKAGDRTTLKAWVEKKVVKKAASVRPFELNFEPNFAPERAAAEWWAENLRNGYLLVESDDNQETQITPLNRTLPEGNCALTYVYENDCGYVNDKAIERLAGCSKLRGFLFSSGSSVTADGLAALRDVKTLTAIRIRDNDVIDNRLWPLLKEWPDLETLAIGGCMQLADPDASVLRSLSKLKNLDVGHTQITGDGVRAFGKHCPGIEHIEIGNTWEKIRPSLEVLGDLQELRSVYCDVDQLSIPGVATLLALPKFEFLGLKTDGVPTDAAMSLLRPLNNKLQKLELMSNTVGDTPLTSKGYAAISEVSSLRALRLWGNEGSPSDQDLLALSQLKHLSTLRLSFTEQSAYPDYPDARRQYTPAGIEAFRKVRPDVRLDVDGVVFETTQQQKVATSDVGTKNKTQPLFGQPTIPNGPVTTASAKNPGGVLAPLKLRMQPRATDLPAYQNTLRSGQPLGEFAAVSRPGKVNDIISWSVEPLLHRGGFRSIDVRDDGLIVTGGHDGALRIWSKDWQLIKVLPGHANSVNAVRFSPIGTLLASVSSAPRDMLAVWDVDSGQLLKFHDVVNWQGHLAWTPDGRQILHAGSKELELIEPLTRQRATTSYAEKASGLGRSIAFSPEGDRFVVEGESGDIHVFETKSLTVVKILPGSGANSVDWSGDGKWIAVGTSSGVDILDTRSFQKRHSASAAGFVKFSPDSTALAVGGNGPVAVYGSTDWDERFRTYASVGYCEFAWTPDSQSILTPDTTIDAVSGKKTPTLNHQSLPEVVTAVNNDGSRVATATTNRLRIWDGEHGSLLGEFPIPKMTNNQLIWQPEGSLLLRVDRRAAEHADRLSLIDTETGTTSQQLVGHQEEIYWACWSPDGTQVASVGNDGYCRIWNAATGKEVRSLVHDDPLWWVVWDPSGAKIATGSAFSQITLWDAADGRLLREFKTLSEPLPKPTLQKATDAPFAFLKNSNQIFYMAGYSFEMLDASSGQITALGKASISGGDRLSIGWSPDFSVMGLYCGYGEFHLIKQGEDKSVDVRYFRSPHWLSGGRRLFGGDNVRAWVGGYDYRKHRRLGVLLPELPDDAWATLSSDGHFVGSDNINKHIVVVALHKDGRLLTLSPDEFQEQYGWKNDPGKVKLLH